MNYEESSLGYDLENDSVISQLLRSVPIIRVIPKSFTLVEVKYLFTYLIVSPLDYSNVDEKITASYWKEQSLPVLILNKTIW